MISKVDMPTWIWDSDVEHSRISTYGFYTFSSFTDVDGNDFISINGKELGEYLAMTIIQESIEQKYIGSTDPTYRYRLICIGYSGLVTFAKFVAAKSCQVIKETPGVCVFLSPTATIIESVVTDIIQYLIHHRIDYKMTDKQRKLVSKFEYDQVI